MPRTHFTGISSAGQDAIVGRAACQKPGFSTETRLLGVSMKAARFDQPSLGGLSRGRRRLLQSRRPQIVVHDVRAYVRTDEREEGWGGSAAAFSQRSAKGPS